MAPGKRPKSASSRWMMFNAALVSGGPYTIGAKTYTSKVELFLEWLYSQQYPKDHRFGAKGRSRKKQLARLKACAFGDRFMAPAFRAASESAFIDSMIVANRSPYYDSIVYAYEHLPSDSSVFQTLVDAHCYGFVEASDI